MTTRLKRPPRADGLPWLPSMPVWVDAWLTSQRVNAMRPAARSGFFDLLCNAWNATPPCTVPDDDYALAQLARLNGEWAVHAAAIRAMFEPVPGHPGRLRNPMQWAVYEDAQARHRMVTEAARKAGLASAEKRKTPPEGVASQRDRTAVERPLNEEKEKEEETRSGIPTVVVGESEGSRAASVDNPPAPRDRLARFLSTYPAALRWTTTTLPRRELMRRLLNAVGRAKGKTAPAQYVATINIALQGNTAGVVLNDEQLEECLRDFMVSPGTYELRYFRRFIACSVPQKGTKRADPMSRKLTIAEKVFLKATGGGR